MKRTAAHRWRATTVPYVALRALGQGAEFIGWVILARRLGTTVFGELAVAALICRYLGLFADFGASIRGVRDIAGGRDLGLIRALIRRRAQITVVLSVAYVAGAALAGRPELIPLVTSLAFLGLNRDWVALGGERGARAGWPTLAQGGLLAAVALVGPVGQPALAPAVAYGAAAVMSVALNPIPKGPSRGFAVDAWMLLAIIANQVLSTADTLLLAGMRNASTAGIYAAVYRIPNAWLSLLVMVRSGLLPVATSVLREDTDQFRHLYRSSLKVGGMAAVGLCLLAAPTYWAVPWIFGPDYTSGQWPAVVLVLATAVATVASPLHHFYLAFDRDRTYALILLGAAVFNVVLTIAAIPVAGMMGAALATLAANLLLGALLLRVVSHEMAGLPAPQGPAPSGTPD